MALELRKYVDAKMSGYYPYTDSFAQAYTPYQRVPIDWSSAANQTIADYPADGALASVNMQQLLAVLELIRDNYNQMREQFVTVRPASIGGGNDYQYAVLKTDWAPPMDETNWRSSLRMIGAGLNQFNGLAWTMLNEEKKDNSVLWPPYANEGSPGAQAYGLGFSGALINVDWSTYDVAYINGSSPFVLPDSWADQQFIFGSGSVNNGYSDAYDSIFKIFPVGRETALMGTIYYNPVTAEYSVFTGAELNDPATPSQIVFLGAQLPLPDYMKDWVTVSGGTWPGGYEEFKGWRQLGAFATESEKVTYNEANFATGHVDGQVHWVKHAEPSGIPPPGDYYYFYAADSQVNTDFYTTGYPQVYNYVEVAACRVFDFQHRVPLAPGTQAGRSPNAGEFTADMRRGLVCINLGRGLDGQSIGFMGLSLPDSFAEKWGAGAGVSKEGTFGIAQAYKFQMLSNQGAFDVAYETRTSDMPEPASGILNTILSNGTSDFWLYRNIIAPDIGWYVKPRIRQVVGMDAIVDLKVYGGNNAVERNRCRIEIYDSSQKGALADGIYALNGSPVDVIEVADGPDESGLRVSTLSGTHRKITLYCSAPDSPYVDWYDNMKNEQYRGIYGPVEIRKIVTEPQGSAAGPVTEEAYDEATHAYSLKRDGVLVSQQQYPSGYEYFYRNADAPSFPVFSPSVVDAPDGIMPSVHQYKSLDPNGGTDDWSYPMEVSSTGPGWFWQDFDDYGRVTKRIDQLGGNAFSSTWPDNDNCTTENTYSGNTQATVTKRAGVVTGRSWRVWDGLTRVADYVATDLAATGYTDAGNLKRTTFYYAGDATGSGAEPWAVRAVVYPDQTASVYSYAYDTGTSQKTVTVATGKPDSAGNPTAITAGTRTVVITNKQGYVISSVTTDIASGVILDSETVPSGHIDDFGRPTEVDYLDGTHISRTYYPDFRGLIQTETDRNGVTTTCTYDILNRLTQTVRAGVTTTITHAGLTTTTTCSSSSSGNRSTASTVDLLGQLVSASSTFEPATTTTVDHSSGQFTATTTETTSGQTVIKTSAEDGSLVSVGGTGTLHYRCTQGIENFAGPGPYAGKSLSFTRQTQLTDSGEDSATYIKTYADGAGRTVAVETPSAAGPGAAYAFSYYNARGQLWKSVDPDGVVTLFGYDDQGRRTTVALDVNKDDLIDAVAGAEDQVTTTVTTYADGKATTITTTGLDTGAGEVSRSVTTLATGATTVTRDGNSTLATTVTPDIPNKKITVGGADGSAVCAFDQNGRLQTATIKDADGETLTTTSYDRDDFGRLGQTSGSAAGASFVTTYNPDGTVSAGTATGPGVAGQSFNVAYTYPGGNRRITVTNTTAGTSRAVEFKGNGDLAGRSGFGTFDMTLNNTRDTDGTTTTLTTTAGNATTSFSANAAGAPTGKTFAGSTAGPSSGYTAGGLPAALNTPAGANAVYGYGSGGVERGLVKAITYPANSDTTDVALDYDSQGRARTITDASGTRTLAYENDRLKTETYTAGPLSGLVVGRAFDTRERRQGLTLTLNGRTLYSVGYGYQGDTNALENVTEGVWSSHYTCKPDTRLIDQVIQKRADTAVLTTTRDYDAYQRLHAITSAAGAATTSYAYHYNDAGKRDTITRENGDYWSIGYQPDGQLSTAVKDNSGGTPYPGYHYSYDFTGIGNRSQIAINGTPDDSREAGYTPNALNQVTGRHVPGFVDVLGRVSPLTDVTVDVRNQSSPVAKKGEWAASTAGGGFNGTGYLVDGNAEKGRKWVDYGLVVEPGAYTVEAMWSASAANAAAVPVTIDAGGARQTRLVNQQTHGGAWVSVGTCTMTAGGRLGVRIGNRGTVGQVIADAVRITRPADAWTQILDSEDAVSVTTITAAKLGDIFHLAIPADNASGPVAVALDVTGTLAGAGHGGGDAVAASQTSVILPPATTTLAHDADGRRQGDWKWTYTWNAAGQLRSVESTTAYVNVGGPQLKLVFDYDAQGRRFSKKVYRDGGTAPAETRYFVYDGWNLIAELNENRAVVRSYTWGLDISQTVQGAGGIGGLLSVHVGTTATYFPTYDGAGNITGLIDANTGTTAATYEYAPFGEPVRVSGEAASACPFGFSTKYTDSETGFCYYGHRYYDPELGRWLTREPLGEMESANLYAFCGNDPVNNVDYLGLETKDIYLTTQEARQLSLLQLLPRVSSPEGAAPGLLAFFPTSPGTGNQTTYALHYPDKPAGGQLLGILSNPDKMLDVSPAGFERYANVWYAPDANFTAKFGVVLGMAYSTAFQMVGTVSGGEEVTVAPLLARGSRLASAEARMTLAQVQTLEDVRLMARLRAAESEISMVSRVRNVAQRGFDYAVENPRAAGLNRMQLGKDAEVQATRWLRKWAERNGVEGIEFQVRGANSVPDVMFRPGQQIFDFKLTPKAVRPAQTLNFQNDFPGFDIDYIFGPGPWR